MAPTRNQQQRGPANHQPAPAPDEHANGGGKLLAAPDPRQMQFKQVLESESFQRSLRAALPKHIRPDKMIRVVLGAMQQSEKLRKCSADSVLLSVMRAAAIGLEPDGGTLGHGYLVPFWSSKNKRLECQFIPGYRGLCKLARNSGEIADVWAEVVYSADDFDYSLGLDQTLKHKRNDTVEDPGPLLYAYAVARFRDGEKKFVVMNRREIESIKKRSQSRDREGRLVGPWVEDEAEMWKKTAVRRLAKYLPLSAETPVLLDDDAQVAIPTADIMTLLPDHPAIGHEDQTAEQADDQTAVSEPTNQNGSAPEMSRDDVLFEKSHPTAQDAGV